MDANEENFGVRRQSEATTALFHIARAKGLKRVRVLLRKRRRRCALPAHSKAEL
jgi:hypothetical protein